MSTQITPSKTEGERLFEQYLLSAGLTSFEYERIFPGRSKRPDYTLTVCFRKYLFDIKDFEVPEAGGGAFDPYARIREKIGEARQKFKKFKRWPCSLVLYNSGVALVRLTLPRDLFASMYGDIQLTWDVDTTTGISVADSDRLTFGPRGKMRTPKSDEPRNTTISALITLRHTTDTKTGNTGLGVIVWENAFARIPLSRRLFRGPFDERYAIEGNSFQRIFAGRRLLDRQP